jgi:SAM-dependent methyltransferase
MFYAEMTREQLLACFPKGGTFCEVGVFGGEFSRKILDVIAPAELHLVDVWKWTYYDWNNPPDRELVNIEQFKAWAKLHFPQYDGGHPDKLLEGFYQDLVTLSKEDTRAAIKLHRGDSVKMAAGLPDGHFDAIYIDADHHYDPVLADLVAYAPKLKPGGILFGDDFLEDLKRTDGIYGTVYAVNTFIKRTDFRCILVTGFGGAQFVLCREMSPYVENFLGKLFNSGCSLVELNDALLPHFAQKTITVGDVSKDIPSFG